MASATSRRWCFTNKYVTTHGKCECRGRQDVESGQIRQVACERRVVLPARSVFVATGARPNVAYEFEHKGHFAKEHGHYRTYRDVNGTLTPVTVAPHCKDTDFGAFTSYQRDHRRVSFVGDTHPVFHGSVVKAIASGQRIYPQIVAGLGERPYTGAATPPEYAGFRARMQGTIQRHGGIRAPAEPFDRGAHGARRRPAARAFQARSVFPVAEFRDPCVAAGRHGAANRGAGARRRARWTPTAAGCRSW